MRLQKNLFEIESYTTILSMESVLTAKCPWLAIHSKKLTCNLQRTRRWEKETRRLLISGKWHDRHLWLTLMQMTWKEYLEVDEESVLKC